MERDGSKQDEKPCEHCGEPIKRGEGQNSISWAARRFHITYTEVRNREASTKSKKQKRAEKPKPEKYSPVTPLKPTFYPTHKQRIAEVKEMLAQFRKYHPGSAYCLYAERRLEELQA